MKRLFLFLLCAALLAGCSPKAPTLPTGPRPTLPEKPLGGYVADYDRGLVIAGSVTPGENTVGGQISYNAVYTGNGSRDYTDPAQYTLSEYISATNGLKWAPHTWETASDRYILDYTTMGFYDFVLNEDATSWTVMEEMAVGRPKDVTKDYVGQFGITAGETARAWELTLNPAACWENGEPITADTYLYSYQQLLDGRMMNRRADSLYAGEFAIVGAKDYLYGDCGWEDVGILKTGDYRLVLITTAPVSDPDFYVPYNLTATYLVYAPLWEACKTCFDKDGRQVSPDSEDIATISTNYCTSLDTSISYGPYRLTFFELDKQITLQRNENWYGYHDGRHLGQYQTDTVACQVIASHSTALLAFLRGDLDSISLQAEDMSRYASSPAIRYQPESYTTKLTFNTDEKALSARGSQILSNVHFRQAFSLAIDRSRFAAAYTSAGAPGYGLLNDSYIYDPFTGASYRSSAGAKNALVQLNGLDASAFADADAAYAAITGYDPALAQGLMQLAWEEAVEAGLYDGESPIVLLLSVFQSQDLYVQMVHFLSDALALACKGTNLEGKVSLEMVVDADYYATMESGLTDLIFSTWGGSAYDPYGVLYRCYCDAGVEPSPNQMEYGFDSSAVRVRIQVAGKPVEDTLQNWARWCAGDAAVRIGELRPFRTYDAASRCAIYSDLEYAYLAQFVTTPLYYRNSARLISYKGDYPAAGYIQGVEYGGIRFYAFDYDDAAWQQVKSTLSY
ncbi:MAG: hypothetical protein IKY59_02465 [Oscillospiraceae bacterium]|nr:hypothetical protein [Oscillospiraceae bacterium]